MLSKYINNEFLVIYNEISEQFKTMEKQKCKELIICIKRNDSIDRKLKNNLLKMYLHIYKETYK